MLVRLESDVDIYIYIKTKGRTRCDIDMLMASICVEPIFQYVEVRFVLIYNRIPSHILGLFWAKKRTRSGRSTSIRTLASTKYLFTLVSIQHAEERIIPYTLFDSSW